MAEPIHIVLRNAAGNVLRMTVAVQRNVIDWKTEIAPI
jgi:hypothetical protein